MIQQIALRSGVGYFVVQIRPSLLDIPIDLWGWMKIEGSYSGNQLFDMCTHTKRMTYFIISIFLQVIDVATHLTAL